MSEQPYFSVVIPLYNKEKYIEKTLESVLNQTFENFEIIVVDDGSTDASYEIVRSIKDARIRLIRQENGGPSKARNCGIREAKGEFIAFLDADDEWLAEKLKAQYEYHLEHPNVLWSSTGFQVKGGKREEKIIYTGVRTTEDALEDIIAGMVIQTSTVVIKTTVFTDVRLLFNEFVKRSEDREVWLKMACLFPKIGYVKQVLTIYRANAEGSLNASAINEMDFPFLSLNKRIEDVLSSIDINRQKKVLSFLQSNNIERILGIWGWTTSFEQLSYYFEPYFDSKAILILRSLNFLPLLVKKVLVKLYLATYGKYR